MKALSLLLCVFVFTYSACAQTVPPAITWPAQWHASVLVADNSISQILQDYVPVAAAGEYYYDSMQKSAVFRLTVSPAGRSIREIIYSNVTVNVVDGPTGSCKAVKPSTTDRYQLLPVNFLTQGKFTFVAIEYYMRDYVFFETYHWTGYFGSATPIDYWHTVETNAPFRLMWGGLIVPTVLEFTNVIAGLGDVPNINFLFASPQVCSNKTERIMNVPKPAPSASAAKAQVQTGTAWPLQWQANSYYTGNNFGLDLSSSVSTLEGLTIGEPTVVPIQLAGHYYYDWVNMRECNTWVDVSTGVRTKTLIVNGTYYYITQATNNCKIIPISPVNGPLKYTWPTGLTYVDEQLIMGDAAYARAYHFYFDAFNVGYEHSFHYWQNSQTGSPMQFQGPVLDFPPYGQSMMAWSNVIFGLGGVDVEDIYYVPSECNPVAADDARIPLFMSMHPMLQFQSTLSK